VSRLAEVSAVCTSDESPEIMRESPLLPPGHYGIWQHVVNKVCRSFIAAAATAAWTETSALAAKGNDGTSFAGVAVKLREAVLRNTAG